MKEKEPLRVSDMFFDMDTEMWLGPTKTDKGVGELIENSLSDIVGRLERVLRNHNLPSPRIDIKHEAWRLNTAIHRHLNQQK